MAFEISQRSEFRQFGLVQGDTLPPVKIQVLSDISEPYDITGMTVHFHFRKADGTLLNQGHTLCQITNAVLGVAQYNWVLGDTDFEGIHYGEFQLVDSTGRKQSYKDYLRFDIRAQIDSVSGI